MRNLDDGNPAGAAPEHFDTEGSLEDVDRAKISSNQIRAQQNIAEWRKYLPNDCVEAMISDGWHFRL